MPNLVKEFRVEIGFLQGGQKAPRSPRATRTQNYPAEDRVSSCCCHYYWKYTSFHMKVELSLPKRLKIVFCYKWKPRSAATCYQVESTMKLWGRLYVVLSWINILSFLAYLYTYVHNKCRASDNGVTWPRSSKIAKIWGEGLNYGPINGLCSRLRDL